MNMILLFTFLSIVNVVVQTVKSLCTVRCSTFISASVNAIAYGIYTYVLFFTAADGMSLFLKAIITAAANFVGVYIANALFDRIFKKEIKWKVEVSIPKNQSVAFEYALESNELEYYTCGTYENWISYSVFCPTKNHSRKLNSIMPRAAKYNVIECVKRL